jgi:hypothetical protein
MLSLAAVAVVLLIGVSVLVAIRLLALHRRTGGLPELLLGGMLLLSVGVGYPTRIAAERMQTEWSGAFLVVSHLAIAVGFSLLFVFTWRVFRPQEAWARMLAAAGVITALGKAAHGCVQVHGRGVIDTLDVPLAEILLQTGPVMVAYLWTACEALRYHGAMRRRVRFGLADATVSNRFLLWGLMALSATSGVALNTGAVANRVDMLSPLVLLPSSITGLAQAVLLVLAFVPPPAYLDWVRARAAVAAG